MLVLTLQYGKQRITWTRIVRFGSIWNWYNWSMTKIENTSNGIIVRNDNGRFAKGTNAINKFTPDNARLMVQKRIDKFRRSAAIGITKEIMSIDSSVTNVYDAWQFINARFASQIINSDIPRGDDIRALGQNIGAISSKDNNNNNQSNQIDNTLANDTLILLRNALLSVYSNDNKGDNLDKDTPNIIIVDDRSTDK